MNITKKITKVFVLAIFTIIILAANTKVFGVFEKKIGEIEYFKQSDLYTNAFYCLDETTLIPKTGDIKIPYRLVGYFEVDTSKQSNPVTSKGSVKLKTSYDSKYGNSFENCALGMAFALPRLMKEDDNYIKKIANGKLIDRYDWESKGWDMYKANNYAQNIIWSIHGMDTHLNREGWYGTVIETYYYDNLETIKNRKSIRVKDKGSTISDKSKFKGLIFEGTDFDGNNKIDENNYTIIGPFTYQASKGDYINKVEVKYNGNTVTLGEKDNDDILLASRADGDDFFKNGIVITTGKENPTSAYDLCVNAITGKTGIYTTLTSSTGTLKNGYKPEFYVLVKNGTNITKIDEIKLEIARDQAKGRFEYYNYAKGEKWSDGKVRSAGNFVNKNGKWYKGDASQEGASGEFKRWIERHYIKFEDISLTPPVNLTLNKVNSLDLEGNELYNIPNIPFNIKFEQDGKEIYNKDVTTGKDGKVKIENVIPNSQNDITVTITEKKDIDGDGYKVLSEPLVITLQCSDDGTYWKEKNGAGKLSGGEKYVVNYNTNATIGLTVKLENKSIIEKLTLSKTSSVGGGKVEGAKFKLTLTNVASIKNHQIPEAGKVTIIETTNSDGNLVLEDIEIKNLNEPVVITIEEIEAPVGYKKIEGKITVTLKRKGNTYTIHKAEKENTVTDDEFKAGEVTLKNHELELDIQDIPVMNLGGIVWYEGEIIDKDPTHAEAERKPLETVKVSLYKGNNKNAVADTTSSDGTGTATYTNNKGEKITENLAKGEYMFTDIPAGDDYYVVFEYDGIEYQAITNSKEQAYMSTTKKDSKIEKEPNRDKFNTATTTISGSGKEGESITNAGWIIKYDLDNNSTPNKAIYKATYKNEEDMKNNIQQYVKGQTYTYLKNTADWMGTWNTDGTINKSHYAFDINCGLNKKFFDLSLGTDVKEATVKINGNQTTYTYDQILDGKLDEKLNKSSNSPIEYNLYLAHSDYNYRITDYKVPGDPNGEPIENKYDETTKENFGKIKDNKNNTELEVYVTYKLALKNQSTQYDAKVNLVEYHFDDKYAFLQEKNKNIKLTEGTNLENRVLMIDTSDLQINGGETKSLDLTFKVLPDKNGNKCVLGEDYLNQAEIVSYTTGGGLVDEDSAPGNAFLEEGKVRYEDDTDEANGIQIKLKTNAERSISGKVFDASNNNGVSDVIVQLIELVEINNQQYEYIWQETVAAPKDKEGKPTVTTTVKTTATSGGRGETYTVENVGQGEYKFTERIIPGNYIVRFIYGDGTYFDESIESKDATEESKNNIKTYNGEDYKSTYVDYNYNAKWYNNTSLKGEDSKAVDNEARRLKVMSYAVDVDGTKGTKGAELALLSKSIGTDDEKLKAVLKNTWMCAETLKIKVPVDTDVKDNTSDTTEVGNGSSPTISNTQFNNVNFGLMERPKTKLVLEKHITGLTVKPVASGVNLIANATADINKILDQGEGDQIQLEGQRDGLSATKSGRTNRGLWYLQTDTTELAQGADAYITYTYVIRNEGDIDYLNKDLISYYEAVKAEEYAQKLSNLEGEVKDAKKQVKETPYKNGTYISNFYYTGEKGENDKEVLASVEKLQEALNPKVKFVDSTTDFSKTDRNSNIKYAYYDTNGNMQENDSSINEIITSTTGTGKMELNGRDTSKKLVVSVGLSASEIENDGVYDSYIAQVTHYTNAAGRRDQSTPANLSYVHSEDTGITLDKYNEEDEFWAETFRITKPTGEDKITPVQLAIITISAVAVLGVGIILIKKFVLKK